MADKAVRNAYAQRQKLEAEMDALALQIEVLRTEIVGIDRFIDDWHNFSGTPRPRVDDATALTRTARDPRAVFMGEAKALNPRKAEIRRAVREIIEAKGAPISRDDLWAALQARGMEFFGASQKGVLLTALWRSRDSFVRLDRWGYWLAEQPWPPAGYSPALRG